MTDDKLTIGSVFSGIGGIELGLERTGRFRTVWQCENNEYARRVLAKNWPGLPIYADVKELYRSEFPEPVDVLCGGFPCQPFSTAGKRRGESDERFLWPEFVRIVREVRPRWVVAENVPGLLTIDAGRVFGRILRDLAECGYYVEWDTISAASVGALHPRNRIFIVGRNVHADGAPGQLPFGRVPEGTADAWGNGQAAVLADADGCPARMQPRAVPEAPGNVRRGAQGDLSPRCGEVLADTMRSGLQAEGTELSAAGTPGEGSQCANVEDTISGGWDGRMRYIGKGDHNWEHDQTIRSSDSGNIEISDGCRTVTGAGIFSRKPTSGGQWAIEPDVGRVANGVPSRVDRLRCLGNAVVPQCAQYIGERIVECERGIGVIDEQKGHQEQQ